MMSVNRSVQWIRMKRSQAAGAFPCAVGNATEPSDSPPGSGRGAWWCFWGALALASAALESQPGWFGSSLRGDPIVQFAYLDPGAGSFIIQALVAAVAGIAVTMKVYWHRIVGLFGRATPNADDEAREPGDGD